MAPRLVHRELDEVRGGSRSRRADHRDHLAVAKPSGAQLPIVGVGIVAYVGADLAAPAALGPGDDIETDVLGEHGADGIPVASIEELDVAGELS